METPGAAPAPSPPPDDGPPAGGYWPEGQSPLRAILAEIRSRPWPPRRRARPPARERYWWARDHATHARLLAEGDRIAWVEELSGGLPPEPPPATQGTGPPVAGNAPEPGAAPILARAAQGTLF
jgi:hypothetical protein